MNFYQENGYLDAKPIIDGKWMYNWLVGGKGMGKTMNVLIELLERDENFVFIRRTEKECKKASNKDVGDIAKVMTFLNIKDQYEWKKIDDLVAIYKDDELKIVCGALSTIGNLTGINLEPFDYLVFDEFIPKPNERLIKGESSTLPILFDTINRNKELDGRKPPKLIALGNSFSINNPQFMCYDLILSAEKLLEIDKEYITKGEHLICIFKDSPILKKKAETKSALNNSSEFNQMAVGNKFVGNDFTYIKKRNITEYQCICNVGLIYIYVHKSNNDIYVCRIKGRCANDRVYSTTTSNLERFRRKEWRLWGLYLDGFIYFDSYDSLNKFEYYMGK